METRILEGYPISEKEAYLGSIASLATADREATEEEIDYLNSLASAAGIDPQLVASAASDSSNQLAMTHLETLKNSDLRYALITDLLAFAKSDATVSKEELDKISKMSSYLGISAQQTEALNEFVDKGAEELNASQHKDGHWLENSNASGILKNANIPTGSILKGLLGIAAPLLISQLFKNRSGRSSSTGGGLLGSVLSGGLGNASAGGGLGSIFSSLSGGRGYGGLGSVLGSLFQRK